MVQSIPGMIGELKGLIWIGVCLAGIAAIVSVICLSAIYDLLNRIKLIEANTKPEKTSEAIREELSKLVKPKPPNGNRQQPPAPPSA